MGSSFPLNYHVMMARASHVGGRLGRRSTKPNAGVRVGNLKGILGLGERGMKVTNLTIEVVKLVVPRRFSDPRGYLVETWNRRTLAEAGVDVEFVQDNTSLSRQAGTVRGLHYQTPPMAQAKLVRVVRGSVFDVAVDLRRESPSFGRHVSAVLTAEGGEQLFVPVGFAHGFCTLEPDTEIAYKVSSFYSREHDTGVVWDDPDIGIGWPLQGLEPLLSEKDVRLPRLAEAGSPF